MRQVLRLVMSGLLSIGMLQLAPVQAKADDAGLRIVPPKIKKTLDPNRTYLVSLNCTKGKAPLPVKAGNGFFWQTNTAATQLLAITESNTNTFPAPATAKAFIAVYAISGDQTNRTTYVNPECSTRFFLTARKPLYLLTNASKVEANTLGTGLKLAEAGLALASSIWPLFTGLPIPSSPAARFSAVKNSSGPISDFVAAFNEGASPTVPYLLREGTYTIDTDYSHVTMKVEPLISIVGLNNKTFTGQYEDAIAQVFKDKLSSSLSSDQVVGPCLAIANQMRDQQAISSLDISYGLLFLSRDAGLQSEQIIRCLGSRYANQAVQFVQSDWDQNQQFDAETVTKVLAFSTVTLAQPAFNRATKARLAAIMGGMRAYATAKGDATDDNKAKLNAFLSPLMSVNNETDTLTLPDGTDKANPPFKLIANWQVMDELKKTFTRFGCLYHDNDSLALFLALPEAAKSNGKYQATEVIGLRLWLNSKQQISQLEIAFDGADIGAAIKANTNACGPNVAF